MARGWARWPILARLWIGCIADRIVVALTERRSNLPVERLLQMRLSGIRIEDVLNTYEIAFEESRLARFIHRS